MTSLRNSLSHLFAWCAEMCGRCGKGFVRLSRKMRASNVSTNVNRVW
jgi:hypothetical protein